MIRLVPDGVGFRSSGYCHVVQVDIFLQKITTFIIPESCIQVKKNQLYFWVIIMIEQSLNLTVAEWNAGTFRIAPFDDKKVGSSFQNDIHGIRCVIKFAEQFFQPALADST